MKKIKLILSDVDGVLTDGGIIYDSQGNEIKKFNVRDGFGIRLWQKAGYEFGLVTGRSSHIVRLRANELGLSILRQGVRDKLEVVMSIAESRHLTLEEICFIGDDFPDLPVIRHVGLGVTVADAPEEIRQQARLVTSQQGGHGAVRELIETVLKAQNLWESSLQTYFR